MHGPPPGYLQVCALRAPLEMTPLASVQETGKPARVMYTLPGEETTGCCFARLSAALGSLRKEDLVTSSSKAVQCLLRYDYAQDFMMIHARFLALS